MEPAFYRGDLLFLTNPSDQRYVTGDITVYKIPGADIPIVHRVIETHDVVSKRCVFPQCPILRVETDVYVDTCSHVAASPLGQKQLLLTKGDNNYADDIELYQGLSWLEKKHIVGKVRG